MSNAHTRWPGFGPAGTVVIAVDPATWAPPAAGVTLAGVAFAPKRELHVTVIGKVLGARAHAELPEAEVAALYASLDWTFRRTHRLTHVRRDVEQSLIERIELPAMATFHDGLARLLREALPVPPPHVTLYVHGTDEGIGIPDPESLARWTIGQIELP